MKLPLAGLLHAAGADCSLTVCPACYTNSSRTAVRLVLGLPLSSGIYTFQNDSPSYFATPEEVRSPTHQAASRQPECPSVCRTYDKRRQMLQVVKRECVNGVHVLKGKNKLSHGLSEEVTYSESKLQLTNQSALSLTMTAQWLLKMFRLLEVGGRTSRDYSISHLDAMIPLMSGVTANRRRVWSRQQLEFSYRSTKHRHQSSVPKYQNSCRYMIVPAQLT